MKSLNYYFPALYLLFLIGCSSSSGSEAEDQQQEKEVVLTLEQNEEKETISIIRKGGKEPILTIHAKQDFRPFIHPIVAPDGKGVLTEYSPAHHMHQTGLYWGFTSVNKRDFFHNPQGDYWKKVAANIIEREGETVKWQTIYQLLDENGQALMEETQTWSMREEDGKYFLDLEWKGEAKTDLVIGKYDYGGLFLRMPWREGIKGEIVNAARQKNEKAEGQPAMWINVGMQVEGRDDLANITIFDHPENRGYPQKWRVDEQMGVGPAFTRDGDWALEKGKTELIRLQ